MPVTGGPIELIDDWIPSKGVLQLYDLQLTTSQCPSVTPLGSIQIQERVIGEIAHVRM